MTIYDLFNVIPANCSLTLYDRNDSYIETVGLQKLIEDPNYNGLYQKEIKKIIPTNCRYLLGIKLK